MKTDLDLFERLFEEHHRPLYRFLLRMTGSETAAEDLMQETFARALKASATYAARGRDQSWLYQIARNLLADRFRRASHRPRLVEEGAPPPAPEPPTHDLRLSLLEALATLSESKREAFLLREIGGLHYNEIAEITDSTVGAIRNRIHRARRDLKSILSSRLGTDRTPSTLERNEVIP